MNMRKCGIIGCGAVGASLAYTLAGEGLFTDMVLLDVLREKAEGEALDIGEGNAFTSQVNVYAGDYSDLGDAGIVYLCAGVAQKAGEGRLQLLGRNMKIFDGILRQLIAVNTEAILVVVTNPVDILTYYTWRMSGFPAERVIGSGTVLDTARLKKMIGDDLSVNVRNVHAFILGEHGDSELPVFSSANISGVDLADYYRAVGREYDEGRMLRMFERVRDSAYRIIERKGATYYGIARAVSQLTKSILLDENAVLTVSTPPRGAYGLEQVCLGLPAVVGAGGVLRVLEIPLSEEERGRLCASAEVLRGEYDSLLASLYR